VKEVDISSSHFFIITSVMKRLAWSHRVRVILGSRHCRV